MTGESRHGAGRLVLAITDYARASARADMCGIAGLVGIGESLERALELTEAMCARMHHRGPDGAGVAGHGGVTLGMRRLAIVDVEHGQQPMANDDDSIVIVYNGEIYNAPELRRELEAQGLRFRTRSDTEVILRLYELDPELVEERLAGMWAFAIHDRRRARLTLSRDRFGIKPLFIAEQGRALAFASELRCFDRSLPSLSACFRLDPASAHAMLAWAYVPEESTIYSGVRRLAPGTRLVIDLRDGTTRARRYWNLVPSADAARVDSLGDACDAVEALLARSVREHLESDVPVATFLSGGIDSSLVTHFAVRAGRMPIKAFSVGFREPRFDESPFARESAEILGLPLEVAVLDERAARSALAEALLAYDEPFGDSSSLATYLLCQHVARQYKVALGGDGGDEVFAGYKKHQVVRVRQMLDHVPGARRALTGALARVPTRTDRSRGWTEVLRTAARLARGLQGDDAHAYVALTQVGSLAKTAALVQEARGAERFEQVALARFEHGSGSILQRTLAGDLANPLPNDMLTKVDRASMANRLEARVPFLDHRVVEFGVGLDASLTLAKSGKRVLRALHERIFGARLARRQKHGFGVPVERWLRTSLGPACERLFESRRLDRSGLLSSETLGNGRYIEWVRRDPQLLWHALALAVWLEACHGDGPDAVREMLRS